MAFRRPGNSSARRKAAGAVRSFIMPTRAIAASRINASLASRTGWGSIVPSRLVSARGCLPVADRYRRLLEYRDRPIGPVALCVRQRQCGAGGDQRAGILLGGGERLLEVRDRVRLPGAPLCGAQQEQQRTVLPRCGGL